MVAAKVTMEFADALVIYRRRMAINQKELADAIGVTVATISRYERGRGKPVAGSIIDRAIRSRLAEYAITIKEA